MLESGSFGSWKNLFGLFIDYTDNTDEIGIAV